MSKKFEIISEKWIKMCNVKSDTRHGDDKPTFAGNNCNTLLDKVDILRSLCNQHDIGCLKFVECFQNFKKVVKSCFSNHLSPDFETFIENFKKVIYNYK